MTLGPALVILGLAERWSNVLAERLSVFGKVSLFFYLIHVPLINAGAHLYTRLVYGVAVNFYRSPSTWPGEYDPSLLLAYLAWGGLIGLLYFPCLWFSRLKARSNNPWLSYL